MDLKKMKPENREAYLAALEDIAEGLSETLQRYGAPILEPIEITLLRIKRVNPTGYKILEREARTKSLAEIAAIMTKAGKA